MALCSSGNSSKRLLLAVSHTVTFLLQIPARRASSELSAMMQSRRAGSLPSFAPCSLWQKPCARLLHPKLLTDPSSRRQKQRVYARCGRQGFYSSQGAAQEGMDAHVSPPSPRGERYGELHGERHGPPSRPRRAIRCQGYSDKPCSYRVSC
jgi:hypothetical protein